MDLYDVTSASVSQIITKKYSTSFSLATSQFPKTMRQDIYNIYGLVRLADEIVDTYRGSDALELLDDLEQETYKALTRKYSTNIVVHAFMITANKVAITKQLIQPFFKSMRLDLKKSEYNTQEYKNYIYGSAEVVGLMCLKVFCMDNKAQYNDLENGAKALGSAFQKVNFLRDLAIDNVELGRIYFPGITFDTFNEKSKTEIVQDIEKDFKNAYQAIIMLPNSVKPAVLVAHTYYKKLLSRIKKTPIESLKNQRVRIPDAEKIWIICRVLIIQKIESIFKR